jgi:hypothetical protein
MAWKNSWVAGLNTTQKGVGAVDRIDHPHPPMLEPRRVVLGLLGEPAIVGAPCEQIELERGIDGEVGFAHLRAVGLPFDQDLLAEIGERKFAGVARRGFKKCVIFFEPRRGKRALGGLNGVHCRGGRFSKLFGRVLSTM